MQPGGRMLLNHEEMRPVGAGSAEGLGVRSADLFCGIFRETPSGFPLSHVTLVGPKPMSARPIATGTISFGLVSIPVKLYAASDASAGVSFNMLHGKDGARLKQQYICTKDGEIVPRDQMVKGYEFSKDQYVTFTTEELKALEEQSTQSIEVVEFVPIAKVDPVYFDKAYYLGPDKGGAKAYALLSKVMLETAGWRSPGTPRAASSTSCCCAPWTTAS